MTGGQPRHGDARRGKVAHLYKVWYTMRRRCYDPDFVKYPLYGGRGIRVCREWWNYEAFRDWALSHGYQEGLTIERRNHNGNYTPTNCCWIPRGQQQRNTRQNHWVTAWGETKLLHDWEKDPRCAVRRGTIRNRLRAGDTPEAAISDGHRKTGPKVAS